MNKLVVIGIIALATPVRAEDAPLTTPNTLGIDGAVVMPTDDYADTVDFGVGALVRFEVPAGPGFVYGRTGAIVHSASEYDGTLVLVPFYGGYRYPFGASGAYAAGELGITYGHASIDTQFGRMSDSDTELGFMLSAGLRRGKLDLRGALFWPDDDAMGLMASAGFDFASF